ncbi:LuxR C-terminal-related transcriptional regulator [Microbacterium sp. SORGH_AS_0888]|uniref:helix-turn-helix transcriptional regulator n=1 Tax=Microbacterium sp. SORGH_AS_0888 TaxID=3041791 RepID=UPI00277DCC90|nr:LuxR C-terminal-related transcriptional regulator [Microbacterium sp. SORGH_AS_0888]MDQ1130423.1 ATP/maltotriose-dependent transcriptional regulator MalT [Microbacterium sp. SORGH_AS_0888]
MSEYAEAATAIRVRLSAVAYEAARELAEAERARLRRRMPSQADALDDVTDAARADLWTAIAEAEFYSGRLRAASEAARAAIEVGGSRGHIGHRAQAMLAVAYALNGETSRARRAIWLSGRVERGCPALALAIAEASVSLVEGDLESVEEIGNRLFQIEGAAWAPAAGAICSSLVRLLRGDASGALAEAAALTSGIDVARLPPILRMSAVQVLAASHLVRGDRVRVLSVLGPDHGDDPTHLLCRCGFAGAAMLPDALMALRATDVCLRVGAEHSLSTLPRTLLVRALAYRQLGDLGQARMAAEEAVSLAAVGGGCSPSALIGLDGEEVLEMLNEVFGPREQWAPEVADVADVVARLPRPTAPAAPTLPHLTPRERVVAAELRTDATIPEIAATLRVSFNTVKTQTRSLYLKLGVSSREQAIERLELAGFFLGESC